MGVLEKSINICIRMVYMHQTPSGVALSELYAYAEYFVIRSVFFHERRSLPIYYGLMILIRGVVCSFDYMLYFISDAK